MKCTISLIPASDEVRSDGMRCRCHLEKLFGDENEEEEQSKCPITGLSKKADERTEEEEDQYNALALWIAKFSCPGRAIAQTTYSRSPLKTFCLVDRAPHTWRQILYPCVGSA